MPPRAEIGEVVDLETDRAIREGRMSPSWPDLEGSPPGVYLDDEVAPGAPMPEISDYELILRDGTRAIGKPLKWGSQTGWVVRSDRDISFLRPFTVVAWRQKIGEARENNIGLKTDG